MYLLCIYVFISKPEIKRKFGARRVLQAIYDILKYGRNIGVIELMVVSVVFIFIFF